MWICVKESVVVLTPCEVALQDGGRLGNHLFFTYDFYTMADGLFFEVLEWLGVYSNRPYIKPVTGVNPVIGKSLPRHSFSPCFSPGPASSFWLMFFRSVNHKPS